MTSRATSSAHRGGCLCGAIRFLSQADPVASIAWFETADALPRFEGAPPEQPRA